MARRLVFLGDTITDGSHFPAMVRHAMKLAGKPIPICINCGATADSSEDMLVRLPGIINDFEPDLVVLGIGINDLRNEIPLDVFEDNVCAMHVALRERDVDGLVMTMPKLSSATPAMRDCQEEYNRVLRNVARQYDFPVAEVYRLMDNCSENLLATDRIHPNEEGNRLICQAILAALGYPDVPAPEAFEPPMLPGVIPEWWIKRMPGIEETVNMTIAEVTEICNSATWNKVTLPLPDKEQDFYSEVARRQGYAINLKKAMGRSDQFICCTQFSCKQEREAYVNVGGLTQGIYLNGKRIYRNRQIRAFHAGQSRIHVTLKEGQNVIVVTCGPSFFLSITEGTLWC